MTRTTARPRIVGSNVGYVTSYERDEHAAPPPSRIANYLCGGCDNAISMRLHAQAEIPTTWTCPRCSAQAEYAGDEDARGEALSDFRSTSAKRGAKSHWDHLAERRTEKDLEALLAKRLQALRAGKLHVSDTGLEAR